MNSLLLSKTGFSLFVCTINTFMLHLRVSMETQNKQKALGRNNHISLLNFHCKGDVCLLLDPVNLHICHWNANFGISVVITD